MDVSVELSLAEVETALQKSTDLYVGSSRRGLIPATSRSVSDGRNNYSILALQATYDFDHLQPQASVRYLP